MKEIALTARLKVGEHSPLLDEINLREFLDLMLVFPGDGGVLEARIEELEEGRDADCVR